MQSMAWPYILNRLSTPRLRVSPRQELSVSTGLLNTKTFGRVVITCVSVICRRRLFESCVGQWLVKLVRLKTSRQCLVSPPCVVMLFVLPILVYMPLVIATPGNSRQPRNSRVYPCLRGDRPTFVVELKKAMLPMMTPFLLGALMLVT